MIRTSQTIQNTMSSRQTRWSNAMRAKVVQFTVFCCLICVLSGCSSTNLLSQKKIYKPNALPLAFNAPVPENAQTVDLAQFAVGSVSNEFIDKLDILTVGISSGLDKSDTVSIDTRVDESGNINIPIIGTVPVAQLEPVDAEAAITGVAIQRRIYKNPHITVTMKKKRENRVTVIGAVKSEGEYKLPHGKSDLLSALVAAGGLSTEAGTLVEITNGAADSPTEPAPLVADNSGGLVTAGHSEGLIAKSTKPKKFSVDLVSSNREKAQSYVLEDGAIVRVERRDPKPLHVMGLVRKPGPQEYPVSKPLTVLEAVALAGGISNPLSDKVYVIRELDEQEEPVVIQVSLAKAKRNGEWNLNLAPGDIVSIEQTPATVFIEALRVLPFGVSASLGAVF